MAERCRAIEPLLSAWVDDELVPRERRDVVAHLQSCAGCSREVEELRFTRTLLRAAPVRRLPREADALEPRPRRLPGVVARTAAAAALGLGVLAGAAFALGGEPAREAPMVRVPLEVYLADHLVHSAGSVVPIPALVEERP